MFCLLSVFPILLLIFTGLRTFMIFFLFVWWSLQKCDLLQLIYLQWVDDACLDSNVVLLQIMLLLICYNDAKNQQGTLWGIKVLYIHYLKVAPHNESSGNLNVLKRKRQSFFIFYDVIMSTQLYKPYFFHFWNFNNAYGKISWFWLAGNSAVQV